MILRPGHDGDVTGRLAALAVADGKKDHDEDGTSIHRLPTCHTTTKGGIMAHTGVRHNGAALAHSGVSQMSQNEHPTDLE